MYVTICNHLGIYECTLAKHSIFDSCMRIVDAIVNLILNEKITFAINNINSS
jgi:hypothetical protein